MNKLCLVLGVMMLVGCGGGESECDTADCQNPDAGSGEDMAIQAFIDACGDASGNVDLTQPALSLDTEESDATCPASLPTLCAAVDTTEEYDAATCQFRVTFECQDNDNAAVFTAQIETGAQVAANMTTSYDGLYCAYIAL